MTEEIQTQPVTGSALTDPLLGPDLPQTGATVPLVIDLDGTLCRSDTLHEGMLSLIARQPTALLRLPSWLARGKSAFKRQIADLSVLDPALLPYDSDVLEMIAQARTEGRQVGLVSAADHRQVEAVAAHLGIFSLAVGSGSLGTDGNLRGKAKADFLIAQFGAQGFDYLGDSATDLPVWKAARHAFGVRLPPALQRRAASEGIALGGIGSTGGWPIRALIRACRPHQWAKNLLILLPVLASQDLDGLPAALLAMLCFSLTASAIYIVNDLLDLPSDRVHPRKRNRPFASGAANAVQGLTVSAGLLVVSMLLAGLFLPVNFLWILLFYLVTTTLYSLSFKRKMMADVIGLAALYTLRIVAGSMATGIVLSPWLLVFSMFLFFALATIKRQAELEDLALRGKTATEGRNLMVADLPIYQAMSIAAAQAAVLVFALYSQDNQVQQHFGNPDLLLLICPVLMLWIGRMQLMTRRGFMTDDPIVFTLRDRVSLLCGVLMLVIFLVSALGGWA
ncbi:UbiA family prenyltransferase [Falsigemmobacter intermedius]|uniref:UbiA family prenyltransferase n=1 Tax=Falsigemmobacter intermedius TaxID=1553448 RepID=A0A3S3Y1U8_9RHOB|nr:UbiA family prenyltransferase [Falsigemmobacter intermedius]RWY35598.1 UbiA family prenyltransferase [Falsigemmobacter intermedius]